MFTLLLDGSIKMSNFVINGTSLPNDMSTQKMIYFGTKTNPTFSGYLSDVAGGRGSFFDLTGSKVTNCALAIGFVSPTCLLCASSYYLY